MFKPTLGMLLLLLFAQLCTAQSSSQNPQVSQSIFDNGNVGIGTTSPAYKLDVLGSVRAQTEALPGATGASNYFASTNNADAIAFEIRQGRFNKDVLVISTNQALSANLLNLQENGMPRMVVQGGGNVGIGTTNPLYKADIYSTASSGDVYSSLALRTGNYGYILEGGVRENVGESLKISRRNAVGIYEVMRFNENGNVGIGTTDPKAKLEINGSLRFSGDRAETVQTTAWTGVLCGGDYAESVDVSGERKRYEPGDVLVIDPQNDSFAKSTEPYSTNVAGIYSTKPGVVGRRSTSSEAANAEIPMAMVGIVPTKVSAENGPIRRGDLLVTSSTAGYAMQGRDRSRITGAIVGKALGRLDSGTGVIDVLVSLQ